MDSKIYTEKIGNIYIEYLIENKKAYMEFVKYDPEHIKMFLFTLKASIEDLKKHDVLFISQQVTKDDWNEYLSKDDKWKLISHNDLINTCEIQCSIDDAVGCVARGFGVYETHTDYKTNLDDYNVK